MCENEGPSKFNCSFGQYKLVVLEGSIFPIFVTKMGSRQARTTPTLRLIGHSARMFEDHIMVKSTSNVYKKTLPSSFITILYMYT